jgi:hypothetical protein
LKEKKLPIIDEFIVRRLEKLQKILSFKEIELEQA